MMGKRLGLWICFIGLSMLGFRWDSGQRWAITPELPILWIELDAKLYATDGFGEKVNKLKGSMEVLKTVSPEDHKSQIWRSILEDFASVKTTYLKLRLKPGQIPSIDALHTDAYNEADAQERTIKIKVGASIGASSGYSSPKFEGSKIISCEVVLAARTLEDPQFFQHVALHEILHCFGVKHQQEDSDSLMSYSNNSPALSVEERMALTFLYPLDQDAAQEAATFGFACSPK